MNGNISNSFLNNTEDSFCFTPHRKQKNRPVIDSDSDEDSDSAHSAHSQTFQHSEDDILEASLNGLTVEDSFSEEEKESSQSPGNQQSNKLSTSVHDDYVETTDDEEPQVELDLTDEALEEVALQRAIEESSKFANKQDCLADQTELVEQANDVSGTSNINDQESGEHEDIEEVADVTVNNSIYRERKESSSNDDTDDDADIDFPENSDSSAEIVEESCSIVDLSSDEEAAAPPVLKQSNLKSFLAPKTPQKLEVQEVPQRPLKNVVSKVEFQDQARKVELIRADFLRAKNAMRVIKLENLPDKGKSLLDKEKALKMMLEKEQKILGDMEVDESLKESTTAKNKIEVAWEDIEAGVDAVGPRTFGKKGIQNFNLEKQVAVETLHTLHQSLDTRPKETDYVDDPKGLKINLMPHQKRALAWLLWRETQKPSGGLLADDMGLGKTLTMISLVLKSRELNQDDKENDSSKEMYRDKYPGGTLVICPASLMNQWSGEIERRTKRGLLDVELFHGARRETRAKTLAKRDVVITTYALAKNESDRDGVLFGIRWRRIILDEAHQIRNYKSQTAVAIYRLSGKSRWALTGTPVHNKELDMYSMIKFLRCAPFDDLQTWRNWVTSKNAGGNMRLHAVISSLMLRRTKAELMENGALQSLPSRTWELVEVKLEKGEMDVYQRVLIFSRTLFAQFLHQRAEKANDVYSMKFNQMPPDPNGEYFKMRNKFLRMNRMKDVSSHDILVLLLRLRQICCHPCLIKQMLQGDEDLGEAENSEDSEELNLLDQLNKLTLDEEDADPAAGLSEENGGLSEVSKNYLNPSNPVFNPDRQSSKIKAIIKLLKEKISNGDKAILVSQWTSLLTLISSHLKNAGVKYTELNGKVPVPKRSEIVDSINDPTCDTKVLLLSLTAGGVGLNLVGANHLFLLDLHWNPQLENQAQDRIYRMGQNKPIFVYKFMAVDTIEQRIKALQDSKLEIANSILTGTKRVTDSKLSLQDLKALFDFK